MRLLQASNRYPRLSAGFTLVEMLVVAPIAILSIGIIVSVTISMVGDAIISQTRAATAYTTQDALDRIEKDIRLSSAFLSTFSAVQPGQGKNATPTSMSDTTGFSTSSNTTSDTLILNSPATTSDPYDSGRTLVYYTNQPNACGTPGTNLNRPLTVRVVYFLRTQNSVTTLWRRTVVPLWNTNATADANTVCNAPWQRDSCPIISGADCKANDEKMIDNVTAFTLTYYTTSGTTTTNSRLATNVKVLLKTSQSVAGSTVTQTNTLRATRTNETVDAVPAAPSVSVLNPSINTYNNPLKRTFGWTAAQYAGYYKIRYRVNGGTWTTASTTDTQYPVSGRPLSLIDIGVTSVNDMGESSETLLTGQQIPLWTDCNLASPWVNYGDVYATAAYTITTSNIVVMKGLIKDGPSGTTSYGVCKLPVGLRPSAHLVHTSTMDGSGTSGIPARIDVGTAGGVDVVYHPTPHWVSLDGVKFVAAGAVTWTNAVLQSGWTNYATTYGGPYAPVQYAVDASGRTQVQGLLTPGTQTSGYPIWFVPAALRPSQDLHFPTYANSTVTFPLEGGGSYEFNSYGVGASDGNLHAKGTTGGSYETNQTMWLPASYSGWLNLTLQNSWVHYGAPFATPQYTKASDGMVHVKGLIYHGNTPTKCPFGQVMATLPAGYRPRETQIYLLDSYANFGRIDVRPNGEIICVNNNYAWTALDNIKFLAEQ